jgi:hypothetical protein
VGGDKRVHTFRLRGSLFLEASGSTCVRQAAPFCAGYRRIVEVVTWAIGAGASRTGITVEC